MLNVIYFTAKKSIPNISLPPITTWILNELCSDTEPPLLAAGNAPFHHSSHDAIGQVAHSHLIQGQVDLKEGGTNAFGMSICLWVGDGEIAV